MIRFLFLCALLGSGLLYGPKTWAVEPDEILADPALEQRARNLSAGLRCLVCQNESIDSSNAELAKDLRILVRERLVAGDSDQQVLDYLVSRYGDFVLLKPPVKPATYLLWFGPVIVVGAGLLVVGFYFRGRSKTAAAGPDQLNAEEEARLESLLDADGGKEEDHR